MTTCKTGADHIKSLKDGRTVYIDGKLVPDVTEHPAFRNAVKSAAMLYDFQAKPENIELMTFVPNGSNRRATMRRSCSGERRCRPGPPSPTAS
jgi:4-hydroxyphenylacetate 3-monooxygenase